MVDDTPKDIAVFIDGTWNRHSSPASTNVRKLYRATRTGKIAGRKQVKLYISGVGTKPVAEGEELADEEYRAHLALHLERELPTGLGPTRAATGGAFGKGTAARIKAAYSAVCDEFDRKRSDKVFLFGFSRGAFAARSLAGCFAKRMQVRNYGRPRPAHPTVASNGRFSLSRLASRPTRRRRGKGCSLPSACRPLGDSWFVGNDAAGRRDQPLKVFHSQGVSMGELEGGTSARSWRRPRVQTTISSVSGSVFIVGNLVRESVFP